MASNRAKLLWEQGIGLNQAWLDFAPPELANEVAQTPGFAAAIGQSPLPNEIMEFGKSLTRALGSSQRRAELEGEIEVARFVCTVIGNG